ncbi:unnamed protein product, partial [Rotaria sp. Silwood2]
NSNKLKVLLELGGWYHRSQLFSNMVHNKASKELFIDTTIQYLIKHRFHGLDLDWACFFSLVFI